MPQRFSYRSLALMTVVLVPVAQAMEVLEDKSLAETVVVKSEPALTCADKGCLKQDEMAVKAVEDGKLHANELGRVIIYQLGSEEIPIFTPIRVR